MNKFLVLLVTVSLALSGAGAVCNSYRERIEIHDMEKADVARLIKAIKILHTTMTPNRSWSLFEDFARQHLQVAEQVHGQVMFLPFHRQMLYDFETKLLRIDPKVKMGYWNYTLWSQDPTQDPFLGLDYFGDTNRSVPLFGNGELSCITNGKFAGWEDSLGNCVNRQYSISNRNKVALPTWGLFESFVLDRTASRYNETDAMRRNLEQLHGSAHVYVNGTMYTMASSMDPIFYFLHGFIDHVWHMWQKKYDAYEVYVGRNILNDTTAFRSDAIPGYWDRKVQDVLRSDDDLCILYRPTGYKVIIDVPIPPPVENITIPVIDPTFNERNGISDEETIKINLEIQLEVKKQNIRNQQNKDRASALATAGNSTSWSVVSTSNVALGVVITAGWLLV